MRRGQRPLNQTMRTMKPMKKITAMEASVSPMRRLFFLCSGVVIVVRSLCLCGVRG